MNIPGQKYLTQYRKRIEDNVILRRMGGVLGIDILVKASAFLLIPFYLKFMTQAEFGLYNYLISIIQTISLILNLGMYIPVSKYYHSNTENSERGSLLFTVFSSLTIFLAICLIPVYLLKLDYPLISLLFSSGMDYDQYRPYVFLALLVTVLSFTLSSYLFTSEKIRQIKAYSMSRILFVNILSILAIAFTSADKVSVRLFVTFGAEFVLLIIFGMSLIKEMIPVFSKKILINSLRMGIPVMFSAIFGIVINFGDKFFLEKYGSLVDLSNYYLAFSFASIIPLVFASFQNIWLPLFMKEKDVQLNYANTKKQTGKLVFIFLILSALMWVALQLLLFLNIVPEKYYQVTYILPLLCCSQIIAAVTGLFSNYFVYFEKTQIVTITGMIVSICSLGLALLLIPGLNVYGAALTALISNGIYLAIYAVLVKNMTKKHIGNQLSAVSLP